MAAIDVTVPAGAFTLTGNSPTVDEDVQVTSKAFALTGNPPAVEIESNLLERAVNASHTNEVFIILITITHSVLSDPIRVSSDPTQVLPVATVRGTISNGEEFIFIPFDFSFPNQEADTSPIARLKIDNISREISTAIDAINSPADITIQVVLASTPSTIELELPDFKLRRTGWDVFEVTGDITVEHYDNEPYPAGRFTTADFPGLFSN